MYIVDKTDIVYLAEQARGLGFHLHKCTAACALAFSAAVQHICSPVRVRNKQSLPPCMSKWMISHKIMFLTSESSK
jgi:hypothetical protein